MILRWDYSKFYLRQVKNENNNFLHVTLDTGVTHRCIMSMKGGDYV